MEGLSILGRIAEDLLFPSLGLIIVYAQLLILCGPIFLLMFRQSDNHVWPIYHLSLETQILSLNFLFNFQQIQMRLDVM